MLSKMQAEKGLLPADSPGGTQGSGEGKAISAENKAASGTGRDGHKLLWAGKLKLRRVFRAVEAGCSAAEVGGEAVCPRSCACGLPQALALAAPYFSNDSQWEDKMHAVPATVSNTVGSTSFMNTPGKNDERSVPGAAEADITNCK